METKDANYIEILKKSLSNFEKVNHSQELKLNYQKETIEQLENKFQEYDKIFTENLPLTNEVKRLNEIINEKNRIISEFQQLTQSSTLKFESYINKNKQNKDRKKNKKI